MTFPVNGHVSLVEIFIIFLIGFGSAFRLVSQPQPYTYLTKELNISCLADGPSYAAESIVSIQITKHIDDKPIAIINMRQELKTAVDIKDNTKAKGHINKKSSTSYLNLVISKPDREDAGIYRCQMFYIDENFQMVEKNIIGNVTYEEPDTTGIVANFAKKVSNLTKTAREQTETIHTLEKQLKDVTSKYKQDINILTDKIDTQEKRINVLTNGDSKKQLQLDILLEFSKQQDQEKLTFITKKLECLDKGWIFYKDDQACLQVFGKNEPSKWLSWSKARESCQTYGGDLLQIHDEDKNSVMLDLFSGSQHAAWIGLWNQATKGQGFKYVDGSPLKNYHPWHPGNPSPSGKKDMCVAMFTYTNDAGEWFDTYCHFTMPYVCSLY